MSSGQIYNLVRALTRPYIGAHFYFMDSEIKVWEVKEIIDSKHSNFEYGKIIKTYEDDSFIIKAGENSIHVISYSPKIKLKEGEYLL